MLGYAIYAINSSKKQVENIIMCEFFLKQFNASANFSMQLHCATIFSNLLLYNIYSIVNYTQCEYY